MGKQRYYPQHDQLIRDLLPTHSHAKIAERLGWATELSVRKRVRRLGLCRAHSTVWTPEKDAELVRMRGEGTPFSVVAQALDVTRNASIGRARRLGLKADPRFVVDYRPKRGRVLNQTQKINKARRKAKAGVPKFKPEPIPELPLTAYFRGVSLLDLDKNQCRYPQGDAPDILFCGQPTEEGASWCKQCRRIVYQPVAKRNISPEERERRVKQGRKNWLGRMARAA